MGFDYLVFWTSFFKQSCSYWWSCWFGMIAGGLNAIVFPGIEKTLMFMVVSPMAGFAVAFGFAIILMYYLQQSKASKVNRIFGKLQIG